LALRWLGRRDYTTAELRARLVARGGPDAPVDAVLTALAEQGLVDDRRAAASHVRLAARVKLRGRARVARELAARGLDREIIDEAVAAIPATDEADAIAQVLARKRLPPRLDAPARRRLVQHLLRRGFSADGIRRALAVHPGAGDDDDETHVGCKLNAVPPGPEK
jgi:regulatory protein